jgi:uncharacterized protein YjbI with pentapeptide repeats
MYCTVLVEIKDYHPLDAATSWKEADRSSSTRDAVQGIPWLQLHARSRLDLNKIKNAIRTSTDAAKQRVARLKSLKWHLPAVLPRLGNMLNLISNHWLIAVIVFATLVVAPLLYWIASPDTFSQRLRTLTAIGTGIGAIALFINLFFTSQTVENSRQTLLHQRKSQQDDRFFKAAELLGNERSIDARVAALFALEQLANDSDDQYRQVMEVISTFIRRRSDEVRSDGWGVSKAPQDIEAAITILGRRQRTIGRGEQTGLNLRGAFLRSVSLRNAEFQLVDLAGANLADTQFYSCNFAGARFDEAQLQDSTWEDCILISANFRSVNASGLTLDYSGDLPDPYNRVATLVRHGEGSRSSSSYEMVERSTKEDPVNAGILLEGSYWNEAQIADTSIWGDIFRVPPTPLDLSGLTGMSIDQYEALRTEPDTIPPKYLSDPSRYERLDEYGNVPF